MWPFDRRAKREAASALALRVAVAEALAAERTEQALLAPGGRTVDPEAPSAREVAGRPSPHDVPVDPAGVAEPAGVPEAPLVADPVDAAGVAEPSGVAEAPPVAGPVDAAGLPEPSRVPVGLPTALPAGSPAAQPAPAVPAPVLGAPEPLPEPRVRAIRVLLETTEGLQFSVDAETELAFTRLADALLSG